MSFTPGPWHIHEDGDEDTIITRTVEGKNLGGGTEVCIVTTGSYADHVELANAHLIASAPALYEALILCQTRVFMHEGSENEAYRAADAALKLARGEA